MKKALIATAVLVQVAAGGAADAFALASFGGDGVVPERCNAVDLPAHGKDRLLVVFSGSTGSKTAVRPDHSARQVNRISLK